MRFLKIVFLASETRARVLRDLGDDLASIMLPHPRTWTAAVRQLTNYIQSRKPGISGRYLYSFGPFQIVIGIRVWSIFYVLESGPVRFSLVLYSNQSVWLKISDSDGLLPDVR